MSNREDLVKTETRRRFVLEQRKAGRTTRETAKRAVEKFGVDALPDGWDSRYVSKDIARVLDKAKGDIEDLAAEYRTIEISRLETLLNELWPYAKEHTIEVYDDDLGKVVEVKKPPDERKIDRILAIMDRLEHLYDMDEAPDLHPSDTDTKNIFVQVNQEIESQNNSPPQ